MVFQRGADYPCVEDARDGNEAGENLSSSGLLGLG